MTTIPDSHPDRILAALRDSDEGLTSDDLALVLGGSRDDVSRAVAHLRHQGHIITSGRTRDEFGRRTRCRYELKLDAENPARRRCMVLGCKTVLTKHNHGFTFRGRGPYCFYHRDMESWAEIDQFLGATLGRERKMDEQLACL